MNGDSTREALTRAAIELFGRQGFDATSTRAIAEAADTNQALIGYHFGGKSGLYLAALENIAGAVRQRIGPLIAEIEAELGLGEAADARRRAPSDPKDGLAALHRLTDAFVAMLTSDEAATWAQLILREQQHPSERFDVLYAGIMGRGLRAVTGLVARIRGSDPASRDTRLTALTIFGQTLVFRAGRAAAMRHMGWASIGADEVAAIQAAIRRNVTAMLT